MYPGDALSKEDDDKRIDLEGGRCTPRISNLLRLFPQPALLEAEDIAAGLKFDTLFDQLVRSLSARTSLDDTASESSCVTSPVLSSGVTERGTL